MCTASGVVAGAARVRASVCGSSYHSMDGQTISCAGDFPLGDLLPRTDPVEMPLSLVVITAASAAGWSAARAPMTALRPAAAPLRVVATTAMPSAAAAGEIAPYDQWTQTLDYDKFREEVHELGNRLADNQGEEDTKHLNKMIRWSNACGLIGMATMWMRPINPISIMGLSLWSMSRWTMIAHHTCHGGYNRQDDGTGRFTSKGFALGSTFARCRDW